MSNMYIRLLANVLCLVSTLFYGCSSPEHDGRATVATPDEPPPPAREAVAFDPARVPYPRLSDYGFFAGLPAEQRPNARVLPYTVSTPLFSDYAFKARFVWMPPGAQAEVDDNGTVQFPDHTALLKTFYYPADFRQPTEARQLMETRLLFRNDGQWSAYTYVWNDSQTDASLHLVGDFRPVSWTDEQGHARELTYAVPDKNQCKSCHNQSDRLEPIGPKVRNLQVVQRYPDGHEEAQLSRWQREGFLPAGDYAARFAALPAWDQPEAAPLAARARAYLDINCGHCHRPEGSAHTTGLYLTYEEDNPKRLGWCKPPVAAGRGAGNRRYGIEPGKPDASILVYRMEADDPGIMMPEIGRAVAHSEGVALVRAWIAELQGPGCAEE